MKVDGLNNKDVDSLHPTVSLVVFDLQNRFYIDQKNGQKTYGYIIIL